MLCKLRALMHVSLLGMLCYILIYMLFSRRINSDINVLRYNNINQDIIEFRPFKNQAINCKKIVEGDENEIKKFVERKPDNIPTNETLVKHTQNCSFFRRIYGYDAVLNTEEEKQFPIAFNILLYKEVEQVEILLRIIYRPQNYYCLHIDGFSPDHVHKAAKSLADCFNNVFIVSKTEKIVYESFQRLQADINCMSDHLDNPNWKYLINLPSQEYPIKSNAEIVQILKLLNDTNYTECIIGNGRLNIRYKFKYKNVYEPNGTYRIVKTDERYKDPPHRMVVVKGSAYGVFTRRFVDYVINTKLARDLLEWCRGVLSPDEYYWSTLNHNPHLHVPGSYKVNRSPYHDVFYLINSNSDFRIYLGSFTDYHNFPVGNSIMTGSCTINGRPFLAYDRDRTSHICPSRFQGGWWFVDDSECSRAYVIGRRNWRTVDIG